MRKYFQIFVAPSVFIFMETSNVILNTTGLNIGATSKSIKIKKTDILGLFMLARSLFN